MNTRSPSVTSTERAILDELATHGPSRRLSARMSGRLSLYGLVDECPRGWRITPLGRSTLRGGRVARRTADEVLRALRPVLATAQNMAWSDTDDAAADEADT